MIDACTLWSSPRAASRVAPGASRPKSSVMRCLRSVTIVAPRWCGLVTTFATVCVSGGPGPGRARRGVVQQRLDDANDGRGARPETDRLANHRRIALERRLPEVVRQDG